MDGDVFHFIPTRAVDLYREDTGENVCAFENSAGQEGHAITIRLCHPLDFVASLRGKSSLCLGVDWLYLRVLMNGGFR